MPQSCVVCARPIVHAMCQADNSRKSDVQKIKKKEYIDEAEEGGERTRRGTNEQIVRELRSNLALMKKSSRPQSSFVRCAVQRERDLLSLLTSVQRETEQLGGIVLFCSSRAQLENRAFLVRD